MTTKKKKNKVLVAMSGGVDSSVAALLLQKQGYEVIGVFMNFWSENPQPLLSSPLEKGEGRFSPSLYQGGNPKSSNPPHPLPETLRVARRAGPCQGGKATSRGQEATNKCCSLASFNDARRVANKLGFPLYRLNFDLPFKQLVVDDFLKNYQAGLTPNPCVRCNQFIKFDLLLKKARALGADYIATGHYARIKKTGESYRLYRPKDLNKDQTYFLYTLNQDKLKHILFPLADLTKPEARALARKFKLTVAEKDESQEICFISEKTHYGFLKRHLKLKPGEIKTEDGKTVGKHQGLPLYTIGQRKGVLIGGIGPFYVAGLDYETNTLYVVNKSDDQALFSNQLLAKEINWIGGSEPKLPLRCEAVIRYRHQPIAAIIDKRPDKRIIVRFTKPQRAVTPGQSVVFYKNKKVLGGGIIT